MSTTKYRAGDLLFFYSTSLESRIIEWGTWGPSHVGMIVEIHGEPMIVESTTLCPLPCEIAKRPVSGVQAHRPEIRLAGYNGRVRLAAITDECSLSHAESVLLEHIVMGHWMGEPYDLRGAISSGRTWLHMLGLGDDLGSVFCSALCARLLMRMNRMNWDKAKHYSPVKLLRTVLRLETHSKLVTVKK